MVDACVCMCARAIYLDVYEGESVLLKPVSSSSRVNENRGMNETRKMKHLIHSESYIYIFYTLKNCNAIKVVSKL